VRLTARARADLLAQVEWLAERAPTAARRAAERIHLQLELLAAFPRLAPEVNATYRDAPVSFGRDGFVVRYRVEGDVLLIVRIFHGRQERSL
jgi:plasmid stabilization system protein ParE